MRQKYILQCIFFHALAVIIFLIKTDRFATIGYIRPDKNNVASSTPRGLFYVTQQRFRPFWTRHSPNDKRMALQQKITDQIWAPMSILPVTVTQAVLWLR